mmetsp:Transcript_22932/g.26296  ORF Transcript_22932/g.26296 Transcript_22932/m.26296 type:complete len:171 (+) Transcript_22932:23-535(+)
MGNMCSYADSKDDSANMDIKFEKKDKKKSRKPKDRKKKTKQPKDSETSAQTQSTETCEKEKLDQNGENYEETQDFAALLPKIEDVKITSKSNLKYLKQARKEAVELHNMIDDDRWNFIKEKNGMVLYRHPDSLDGLTLKRTMTVNASLEHVHSTMALSEFHKKCYKKVEE